MVHFFVLTAIAISSAVATSKPVEWQADYGKALAATRADDRPLLVVLDRPSESTSAAEAQQLKTDGEQAKLLASYQLCHVDVSSEYGQKVAKVFKADKFPFTVIIDKTGSVVLHKKQGQLTDAEWTETLSAHQQFPVGQKSMNPGEKWPLASAISDNRRLLQLLARADASCPCDTVGVLGSLCIS